MTILKAKPWREAASKKIEWWRERIVCPAFQSQSAVARSVEKRGQNGLKNQRRAARGADGKFVIARCDRPRLELQRLRIQSRSFDFSATDCFGCFDGCQVL